MANHNKILLGKILGEIYRLQRESRNVQCFANKARIYALLHGFEIAIDEELEEIGFVTTEQVNAVNDVLSSIVTNEDLNERFKGYYDIEDNLKEMDIDRPTATKILKFFNAQGSFADLIKRMDSRDSPVECKNFDIDI